MFGFRRDEGPIGNPDKRRHCRGGLRRSDSHSRRGNSQYHNGRGCGSALQQRKWIPRQRAGQPGETMGSRSHGKEENSSPLQRVRQLFTKISPRAYPARIYIYGYWRKSKRRRDIEQRGFWRDDNRGVEEEFPRWRNMVNQARS